MNCRRDSIEQLQQLTRKCLRLLRRQEPVANFESTGLIDNKLLSEFKVVLLIKIYFFCLNIHFKRFLGDIPFNWMGRDVSQFLLSIRFLNLIRFVLIVMSSFKGQ